MNALSELQKIGVVVRLLADGNLFIGELKNVPADKKDYALKIAKAHKPAIIKTLTEQEADITFKLAGYTSQKTFDYALAIYPHLIPCPAAGWWWRDRAVCARCHGHKDCTVREPIQ